MKRFYILLGAIALMLPLASQAQISVTILNKATSYVNNLDSLAATGTSKVLPYGWHIYQSDGRNTYKASIGDSAIAGAYSFGAVKGAQARIRALGSISSAKDTVYFGADFVNNTGFEINSILVTYTIEQWRLGNTNSLDTTEFDYSSDATGLRSNGATWVNASALDMISPVHTGTVGPLNGNQPVNQSKVAYTIKGMKIAPGAHFWFRWYDHVGKGSNDGMGIQALSITPYSITAGPTVVKTIAPAKVAQITTPGIPDTTVYGKFYGIVISPNYQDPATGNIQFSLRDATGAITCISTGKNFGYKVNIGDSLYITGKIRSYKYLAYIQIDTLTVLSANKVANPASVAAVVLVENNESNLIKLSNYSLIATANWDTAGASVNGGFVTTARSNAGGGNISIFIDKNSDLFLKKRPDFPFNITGIELQSSTTFNGGYFIWPRFVKDIDTLPEPKVVLHTISQVNGYRTAGPPRTVGQADSINKMFFVKGVVHSPSLMNGGTYFNLIDKTGAITILNTGLVNGYNAKIGDSVLVRGTILQPGGLIVLYADSITTLKKGTILLPPNTTNAPITKNFESYLLTLKKMKLVDATLWNPANAKTYGMFEVRITNGKDTFFMDIANTTDLFNAAAVSGTFNVTGVVGENSTNKLLPFNDHYLIIPRGSFDIQPTVTPFYHIGQIKGFNATIGTADSNGVNCIIKGVVQSGELEDTGTVAYAIADNTGAIAIVNLNRSLTYSPVIGDSIFVEGTVSQSNGLTYFGADSIGVVNIKNNTLSPVVLTRLDEKDESALVTVQGYTMWNPNQWDNITPANKNGFNVQFVHGTDTVVVHISKNVPDLYNLPYASKPTGKVDITGIELQKTTIKKPFAGYYLEPRMLSDISANSGINTANGAVLKVSLYPNPSHGTVQVNSEALLENIIVTDITGNEITRVSANGLSAMVDVSSLKAGMYFIQVKSRVGISIQKLIKE